MRGRSTPSNQGRIGVLNGCLGRSSAKSGRYGRIASRRMCLLPRIRSATGVAAANWTTTGQLPYPSVYKIVNGQPVHADLDAGTVQKPTYLILYATGLRGAPNTVANDPAPGVTNVAESVTVTIQGVPARVDYAGPQGSFFGLDQINVVIPPELSGWGILNVRVEAKAPNISLISQ